MMALEACRPGSQDIDDPSFAFLASRIAADAGLAERYECLQQHDASIAAAFHDVPVPEDLADRLVVRLAAEKPRPRISRRRLLAGVGLSAVAAGLLAAVWLGEPNGPAFSEQYVLDEAIRSFDPSRAALTRPLADAPDRYPVSNAVLQAGRTWGALRSFLGGDGVAYDLSGTGQSRAILYVVATSVDGLRSSPALQPFTTAGCSASAWQENGLLYVLVVQGGPAEYQRYIRLPSGPIA